MARLALTGEGVVTVAEVAGTVVGIAFADLGRRVGEHPPVRDRELYLLYVLAAHHGTGVGQALLDVVVLPRHVPAQVWVAEHNPRARRFYARNDLLPDGARAPDEHLGLAVARAP
ncbi:GNAT family N-acetyltransferase [Cellulomonas telluris]|uniref:GNAT family N-acetyltransferase n=1 Tax=Cellulomonas telluris TaxID=2306636 RepID=UPI001FEBB704|nr:GNAT family N-acetyltransferase [Cellulomonas telluris]